MQVTFEIADELVGRLRELAAARGQTLEATVAQEVERELVDEGPRGPLEIRYDNPRGLPRVESRSPGSMKLGPEGVYEYIPFP